jgi:dTDP-4-dehydrorhamnose reductase
MKVLITGANGQLGRELIRQGWKFNFNIQGVNRQELDITNEGQVNQMLMHVCPSVVINAAAYTDVDKAEKESDIAYSVNKNGPTYLARYCADHGLTLIHISTDYVFDGTKGRPYQENDPIAPLGVYGQSKAQGEAVIRSTLKDHIIVRTSWLYGVYRNNFVKTILKLGHERTDLRVVADQFGSPTSAADLAEALLTIVKKIGAAEQFDWGTYHYCGKGITTWHGLAEKIIQLAESFGTLQIKQVTPITTAEWPTPTKRPPYSVLDCSHLKSQFGIALKPWQESLKHTIDRILSEN